MRSQEGCEKPHASVEHEDDEVLSGDKCATSPAGLINLLGLLSHPARGLQLKTDLARGISTGVAQGLGLVADLRVVHLPWTESEPRWLDGLFERLCRNVMRVEIQSP